jgi:hypothetical protein
MKSIITGIVRITLLPGKFYLKMLFKELQSTKLYSIKFTIQQNTMPRIVLKSISSLSLDAIPWSTHSELCGLIVRSFRPWKINAAA